MYDDDAVYVGAYLHHPGDIPMELSERDNPWDSFSELFFVSIDTYNDKENHHGFGITSAGAIVDGLWSGDWNLVEGITIQFLRGRFKSQKMVGL